MAANRNTSSSSARPDTGAGNRPLDLSGDSPELVAFALLRYLAQLEQAQTPRPQFSREWLLDAYTECLDAVRGNRTASSAAPQASGGRASGSRAKRS